MKQLITFFTISTSLLLANDKITLEWLKSKPKTIARDFYINQYLNQDINSNQALEALALVNYPNNKILNSFSKNYDDKDYKYYIKCTKEKTKDLINNEDFCIEAGLSIYESTKLNNQIINKLIKKLQPEYDSFSKSLEIVASSTPFLSLLKAENKTFYSVFNNCGTNYRSLHFNNYIPKAKLQELRKDKDNFSIAVKLIVTNIHMAKAQASLLNITPENLDFKTSFLLAINAIRHKKDDIAKIYLNYAYSKAYYKMDKDNVLFWEYQITQDKDTLEMLSNSWDINLYSLYASQKLSKKQKNIFFELKPQEQNKNNFNISNPFDWIKVLNDTKKIDEIKINKYEKLFSTTQTQPHLAFLEEKYSGYKDSYFITPYYEYIKSYKKDRQALIYSIGRQESRFIPSSISSSYAMGIMQIMPFLSKALAKQLNEKYDIYQQLEPYTNIKYANHHLNYLENKLKHPLLIAYAYNGGIGFTLRTLKKGLFRHYRFEPYLSMELIPYEESKQYGKKVLTNYFFYQNYLNKQNPISFDKLINTIKPSVVKLQ